MIKAGKNAEKTTSITQRKWNKFIRFCICGILVHLALRVAADILINSVERQYLGYLIELYVT